MSVLVSVKGEKVVNRVMGPQCPPKMRKQEFSLNKIYIMNSSTRERRSRNNEQGLIKFLTCEIGELVVS
jgi:hypothetical protein